MDMRKDYKKIAGRGTSSARSIADQMRPSPAASPVSARRSIIDYAKATPADASGKGQIGLNIFSMGKGAGITK